MKLREKNRGQCDDMFAKTFVKKLCALLDYEGDIPYLFIDSWYVQSDEHECKRFNQFLGELKEYLKTNNKIETAHIPQRISPELPELEVKVQSKTEMIT